MHISEEQHVTQATFFIQIIIDYSNTFTFPLIDSSIRFISSISNYCCIPQPNCQTVSFRRVLLESQLSQLELFDQALVTLTHRSENFLSGLRSTSQVDIADINASITKLKVRNQ